VLLRCCYFVLHGTSHRSFLVAFFTTSLMDLLAVRSSQLRNSSS